MIKRSLGEMKPLFKITPKNSRGEYTGNPVITDDIHAAERNLLAGNEVLMLDATNIPWKRVSIELRIEEN